MKLQVNRKLLFAIVTLAVVSFLLIWLVHYLNTGHLIVTTKGDEVAIDVKQEDGTLVRQANQHLSTSLPTGKYVVVVHGKELSVNRNIVIKSRQTLRLDLNPPPAVSVEPVVGISARSLIVDAQQLYFTKPDSGGLFKIDQQNSLNAVPGGEQLQSAKWATPGYGIGQDSNQRLHSITNDTISPLTVPESYIGSKSVTYSVLKNGKLYLGFGKNVYYGAPDTGYKKIYTADSVVTDLEATDSEIAVTSSQVSGAEEPQVTTTVSLVKPDGKVINSLSFPSVDSLDANVSVAWSPDGKSLAISNSGAVGGLYSNSLAKINNFPNQEVDQFAWASSNHLLYSVGNTVWSYDVSTSEASLIANLTPGDKVSQLAASVDGDYVYMALATTKGGEIARVPLNHQPAVANHIYQLDVFLPVSLGDCTVNYVNFSSPVLQATYSGNVASCSSSVADLLNQDGLPSLPVNYIQAPLASD